MFKFKYFFYNHYININFFFFQTLQEEGLRMLKASQRLPSSSHKFSEESRRMSYNVLNLANEYLQAVNEREELLNKSVHFFNSAKNVRIFIFIYFFQIIFTYYVNYCCG